MKSIQKINHIGLRVRELAQTRAFYDKLGFDFIEGPVGPEPVAIMEHPCGININFILNAHTDTPENNILMDVPSKYPGYTHIALEIDNLEEAKSYIRNLNIEITEEITLPSGAVFFFVRDPDNNVIEFHKPA